MKTLGFFLVLLCCVPTSTYSLENISCISTYEDGRIEAVGDFNSTRAYCNSLEEPVACNTANQLGLNARLTWLKRNYDHCRLYTGE